MASSKWVWSWSNGARTAPGETLSLGAKLSQCISSRRTTEQIIWFLDHLFWILCCKWFLDPLEAEGVSVKGATRSCQGRRSLNITVMSKAMELAPCWICRWHLNSHPFKATPYQEGLRWCLVNILRTDSCCQLWSCIMAAWLPKRQSCQGKLDSTFLFCGHCSIRNHNDVEIIMHVWSFGWRLFHRT